MMGEWQTIQPSLGRRIPEEIAFQSSIPESWQEESKGGLRGGEIFAEGMGWPHFSTGRVSEWME
jgi:hypothetical protein